MEKKVLIITGMHRSGTSVVSQWLYKCGLHLGNHFLGPGIGNEEGHFEDVDFIEFHGEILRTKELPDTGLTDEPLPPLSSTEKQKFRHIVESKNNERDEWGWKDPRTCLFLDIYREVLPNALYLIIVRDFASTVGSLINRLFVKRDIKKRKWVDRFIWKTLRRNGRRKKLYKELAEPYTKIWIAYNELILSHISKLHKHSYKVIDYHMLIANDKNVFSHLSNDWKLSLNYVDFKDIYKDKLITKTENIGLFIKNKEVVYKARTLEKQLRAFI